MFVLLGRFFIILFGDNNAASAVHFMTALASAATILFLFWCITHFARKMFVSVGEELSSSQLFTTMAAGVVGGLAYTFSDSCGVGQPLDLSGAMLSAVGCHGGLPVADSGGVADNALDLPQAFLRQGAAAYVANTGYGWGLKYGIGYGERLSELLTEELAKSGTILVGEAVRKAKTRYFLETPRYDVYDEKSLMQWTLFGLPMYAVKTGITPSAAGLESTGAEGSVLSPVAVSAPDIRERPAVERLGGIRVEKRFGASAAAKGVAGAGTPLPGETPPPFVSLVKLNFDFTASGLSRK